LLFEIAPGLKSTLRDYAPGDNRAAPHEPAALHPISEGALLRAQARMSYFNDQAWPRLTRSPTRSDYLKLLLLIALVAVPWAVIGYVVWLLSSR
jgi:hypothetical protein